MNRREQKTNLEHVIHVHTEGGVNGECRWMTTDAYSHYWYGQNDYKAIIFIYMLLKITTHLCPRLRSIDTSINNVNKNIYTYTYDTYIYIYIYK